MTTGFPFPVADYLERIGLPSIPRADEAGLRALHRAQFFTIAFENLDILLGRGIHLAPEALVDKLVERRRGGYCFELNGLMSLALEAFGFATRPLLARVHLHSPPSGRTHQINLVTLGSRAWVMDVGFGGGGPRAPMPLEEGRIEEDDGLAYRLIAREPWGYMMQTREQDVWKDSYSFDLSVATPADIRVGNHFTSTSPDSLFTRTRTISLPVD
jgi:N-hydroxyarylamine O-acetyltransferase